MGHEVERSADDARILAIEDRLCDRKSLRRERADQAELAIDRMRRWQQSTGRFAAQYVTASGSFNEIGGVRLTALELAHNNRWRKARQPRGEVFDEPRLVEG